MAKYIETKELKTGKPKGRRRKTHRDLLTHNGRRFKVCKITFLDLGGKFSRVVLEKITDKDKRGGRQSQQAVEREEQDRERIRNHINRFPHVESHYCRASSTRRYLNSNLSLPKMYAMFLEENKNNDNPYFSTYRRVLKEKNFAFHRPPKDQCSLSNIYFKGDEAKRKELRENTTNRHQKSWRCDDLKNCVKRWLDVTALCSLKTSTFST